MRRLELRTRRGRSSAGRARASQARGRGFETRRPLLFRRRRAHALLAALGALATVVAAAGCGGREANAPFPALGFNDDWATYSPSPDPNRDPFELAKAIGVKVARFPLGWPTVGAAGSRM